ncbi:MAG: glutamate formimidoyltransferase [Erysipelotrichales bacterium]|nr:glutamate formimidoyltransferase [Erysipelotrichales bacterium]MBQ4374203.1 glutamate formimidoyltransferase [Erysipelotrichales bacterium]
MKKLVEFIPNFSVSVQHDPASYEKLKKTAEETPDCILLDFQSDGSHNRSVMTLIGTPEAIEDVSLRLCKTAMENIDMRKHTGAHPRMGATDVMPYVPARNITLEECVELSKRVAKRVWEELRIPSFLFEDSCTREERRNLANCRKGQFEGMNEKLQLPEWEPDFGERHVHETAGITAIGARMPLIAFNVNLDTPDVEIAKTIAKAIRGSSGGFKYCKALGIFLEDRKIAQVSMNMTNFEKTPLYYTYEMIKTLADRYGAKVIGTEVVGLTPAKALLDCAEFYLKIENFHCYDQVMEYRLLEE